MRDAKRIPNILGVIQKIWEEYPDLRLGQLLLNAVNESALYYMEDDEIINYLINTYKGEVR